MNSVVWKSEKTKKTHKLQYTNHIVATSLGSPCRTINSTPVWYQMIMDVLQIGLSRMYAIDGAIDIKQTAERLQRGLSGLSLIILLIHHAHTTRISRQPQSAASPSCCRILVPSLPRICRRILSSMIEGSSSSRTLGSSRRNSTWCNENAKYDQLNFYPYVYIDIVDIICHYSSSGLHPRKNSRLFWKGCMQKCNQKTI